MERREGGRNEKNIAHGRENTQNFFFGVFFWGGGGLVEYLLTCVHELYD